MPKGDPRDGFFYPTLTLMIDSYNLQQDLESIMNDKTKVSHVPAINRTRMATLSIYIFSISLMQPSVPVVYTQEPQ